MDGRGPRGWRKGVRRAAWSLLLLLFALLLPIASIIAWGWTANEAPAWDSARAQGVRVGKPHAIVQGCQIKLHFPHKFRLELAYFEFNGNQAL